MNKKIVKARVKSKIIKKSSTLVENYYVGNSSVRALSINFLYFYSFLLLVTIKKASSEFFVIIDCYFGLYLSSNTNLS